MLFSRAALLLLPLVLVASGMWREFSRGARFAMVGAAVVLASTIAIMQPEIFDYLLLARFLDQTDVSPLGTFEYRFEQWGEIARYLQEHPFVAWFGMGTSGYGTHFFNSPEAGTHNMLFDVWMESGLIAPLVLLVVLAVFVIQGVDAGIAWSNRRVLLIGTFVLFMLMIREHSASYLYVTSLGGFCFAALMYVALLGGHTSGRNAIDIRRGT
jgi:O-antigen ligase